ncbi:MAG: DUF2845 domain-containing protein [Xanthomonadales bacterium]
MPQTSYSCLPLIVAAIGLAQAAAADSYRCGRQVVKDGDSAARLLRLCGEPYRRDSGSETVMIDGAWGPQRVQRWYYRKNRRSLEYVVMVYRGRVVAIDAGRR